jgi:hypothetical protein
MNNDKVKLLSAPFPFEEVEAKVQVTSKDTTKGLRGMVVFYLDSRTIQKRLDEVLGHLNWKNQYTIWHDFEANDTKKMQKSQICGIAIYNDERNEWVGKFDGAECSNIEPIKGGLSDSFKRAACMWGIGRYLYDMDGIWVEVEQRGNTSYIKNDQLGKLKAAYDAAVMKTIHAGVKQGVKQQAPKGNAADADPQVVNNQPANHQPKQQKPATPAQQKKNTPPPAAQQNASVEQPPPAPQAAVSEPESKGNVIPIHDFKIYSMKPAGKESQLLELCNPEGEITAAYVRSSEQGIAVGVFLRNVKLEERTSSYGKYNLLTGYEFAAAA